MSKPHLQQKLAALRESLQAQQKANVAVWTSMRRDPASASTELADYMDFVSRIINMIEEEERKAGSDAEEQYHQTFAKYRADVSDTWPDGRWK